MQKHILKSLIIHKLQRTQFTTSAKSCIPNVKKIAQKHPQISPNFLFKSLYNFKRKNIEKIEYKIY